MLFSNTGVGNGNPLQYSCLEISWTEEAGGLLSMESQESLTRLSGICLFSLLAAPFHVSCLQEGVKGLSATHGWQLSVYGHIRWKIIFLSLIVSVLQFHWLINQRKSTQATRWRIWGVREEGFPSLGGQSIGNTLKLIDNLSLLISWYGGVKEGWLTFIVINNKEQTISQTVS